MKDNNNTGKCKKSTKYKRLSLIIFTIYKTASPMPQIVNLHTNLNKKNF